MSAGFKSHSVGDNGSQVQNPGFSSTLPVTMIRVEKTNLYSSRIAPCFDFEWFWLNNLLLKMASDKETLVYHTVVYPSLGMDILQETWRWSLADDVLFAMVDRTLKE